tara:strand:- start:306 stop:1763 length:1458 start_codon:yes stop_codon:yes gene_type:complete
VAPSATVTANDTAPQEGQYFTLDASATTDADTDPLTFSWVQTAGPLVDIPDATLDVLADLRVPELTATETATFELTVSDGMDSSVVSVDVAFTNIHQLPRFAGELPWAAQLGVSGNLELAIDDRGEGGMNLLAISPEQGGNASIFEIDLSELGDLVISEVARVLETFGSPVRFEAMKTGGFYALEEAKNQVTFFLDRSIPPDFVRVDSINMARPCAMFVPELETGVYPGFLFVGQRGAGFTRISTSDTAPSDVPAIEAKTAGDGRSFCALFEARNAIRLHVFYDQNYRWLESVLALDVDSNSIHYFRQNQWYEPDDPAAPSNVQYSLREVVPLNLETDETLTFVGAAPVSDFIRANIGFAMLFTNGEHNGTHRMVVVGLNSNEDIVQETYSWTTGVPTGILDLNLDGDAYPNLVVLTSTSPDAIVFTAQNGLGQQYLPLTGPEYMDVGLGTTFAQTMKFGRNPQVRYLMVADREDKEVRAYGPLP